MIPKTLEEIASYIVRNGKGILAADESTGTIEKRFKSKQRILCAPPAPPGGLFLFRVLY